MHHWLVCMYGLLQTSIAVISMQQCAQAAAAAELAAFALAHAHRDKVARLVKLAMHLGRVLLMPEPVCLSKSWAAHHVGSRTLKDPWTGKEHVKHESDRDRVRCGGGGGAG